VRQTERESTHSDVCMNVCLCRCLSLSLSCIYVCVYDVSMSVPCFVKAEICGFRYSTAISPDNRFVLSTSEDKTVYVCLVSLRLCHTHLRIVSAHTHSATPWEHEGPNKLFEANLNLSLKLYNGSVFCIMPLGTVLI